MLFSCSFLPPSRLPARLARRLVSELDCLPDAAAASPQLVGAVLQHVQLLAKLCGVVSCVTPRNMMGLIVADMTDVQGQPAAPGG